MGKTVIDVARLGRTIGRIHRAPVGHAHVVARRAIGELEPLEVIGVDVVDRQLAGVQKAEMRGVDVAFQRLQPVAFALAGQEIGLVGRAQHRLERRQRRRHLALAHIDPDQPPAFGDLVGLGLDLIAEVLVCRQIGHVEAIAGDIVFPAVIDAAQPAFLVAAEEQRGAAVRTAVVEYADPSRAVAKGDQPLAQKHQAQRVAIGFDFRRQAGRYPILPHQRPHRGAGADARQQLVFDLRGHVAAPPISSEIARIRRPGSRTPSHPRHPVFTNSREAKLSCVAARSAGNGLSGHTNRARARQNPHAGYPPRNPGRSGGTVPDGRTNEFRCARRGPTLTTNRRARRTNAARS